MGLPLPPPPVLRALRRGGVIPAHPLALTGRRRLDERRQRALTRYYLDAGAVGVAIGVHTTQFAIRSPRIGLYRPVLTLGAETIDRWTRRPVVRIAGIAGPTRQAVAEAAVARDLGYHVGMVSLGGLARLDDAALIRHVRAVAEVVPVMGFYLQPAVGGRPLDYTFWRRLAELENLVAIKIAPFDRYRTLDVVRAVSDAGRGAEIALYTGNDDAILIDLLTRFRFSRRGRAAPVNIVGGLLGHWAVWTRAAVAQHARCRHAVARGVVPRSLLTLAAQVTESNAAIFDALNRFRGSIPGIHEILRRQGILAGRWCLDPTEDLSPGQMREIDRVLAAHPHLTDDRFVRRNLGRWLA